MKMEKTKRRIIAGWLDKASNHLQIAKEHLRSSVRYSETIEAAQECVELSVKSILSFLRIEFSPPHGWAQNSKEFASIARQIQKRQLQEKLAEQYLHHVVRLPRLLFLVNFWAQLYIAAKYGFEVESLAPAQDLFNKEEAELAVQHAQECYQAASQLRHLQDEKLSALL